MLISVTAQMTVMDFKLLTITEPLKSPVLNYWIKINWCNNIKKTCFCAGEGWDKQWLLNTYCFPWQTSTADHQMGRYAGVPGMKGSGGDCK